MGGGLELVVARLGAGFLLMGSRLRCWIRQRGVQDSVDGLDRSVWRGLLVGAFVNLGCQRQRWSRGIGGCGEAAGNSRMGKGGRYDL